MHDDVVRDRLPLVIGSAWFLEKHQTLNPHHWNLNLLLEVQHPVYLHFLEQAVQYLLDYHEGLRMRFVKEGLHWQQFIAASDTIGPIVWINLRDLSAEKQLATIEEISSSLQTSLNICNGPVMRIVYFDRGERQAGLLLWVIHHVLTDHVSNDLLVRDLALAYQQRIESKDIDLGQPSTPFHMYAERLAQYVHSTEASKDLDYGLRLPWDKCMPTPLDMPEGIDSNTGESNRSVQVALGASEFQFLQKYVLRTGVQIIDVLLTTVVQALERWSKHSFHCISVQNHGRMIFDDLNLLHTVGFLSASSRIVLSTGTSSRPRDAVQTIKQQYHRSFKHSYGYTALWCLSKDPETVAKLAKIPFNQAIEVNYLGRMGAASSASSFIRYPQNFSGHLGQTQDSFERRGLVLYCIAFVKNNQLFVEWNYSHYLHHRATIQTLAEYHVQALHDLINDYLPLPAQMTLPDQ